MERFERVRLTNPDKVLFPKPKYTKLDLVEYYLAVADGALRGAGGRPNMLVRFPNGIAAGSFYQKRAPESRPPWIEVVTLRFFGELSLADIAATTGRPTGTIKAQLHRGIERLRYRLGDADPPLLPGFEDDRGPAEGQKCDR